MTLAVQDGKKGMNRRDRRAHRKAVTAVAEAPRAAQLRSLVASAAEVRLTRNYQFVRWGGQEWQQEIWYHYDTVPEFHMGVNIGAQNVSRARLIGVEVDPTTGEPGTQPTTEPVVTQVMGQLFGGPSGQGQALAALYRNLDVAGDCWILATPNEDLDGDTWEVLATTEVTSAGGGRIMIETLDGVPRGVDLETELLFRVWQPHPRRRWDADSPARALMPVLRELSALTAMVSATVKSRLASAGILWIPDEIQLPKAATMTNDVTQVRSESPGAAGWLDLITEAMTAPIQDPDSAGAVVPLVATVPYQYIDKITHMSFGKDLDAMIQPLREDGVKRLAVGMNLPSSILLGLETANHWTAWAITEDYAKGYLAPKLELIADALTNAYLRPALRALGVDAERYAIYFDLDKLVPRQVSVENAQAAYDAGVLKEVAYLEALGFSTEQMADAQERARRLITELLARGNPQTLQEVGQTIAYLFPGINIQPLTAPLPALGAPPAADAAAPAGAQTPPAQTPPPTSTPPGANGAQ